MFCANCACELPTIARFCVRCGSSQNASHLVRPEISEAPKARAVTCSKCGIENPSDYSFCTRCGEQLKTIGSPVFVSSTATGSINVTPVTQQRVPDTVAVNSVTPDLTTPTTVKDVTAPTVGVGGWLLLFCIATTVFSPLLIGAEVIQNPNDTFVVLVDISLAALSIYTGIAVWRVRPNAFKMLKVYFIVTAVLAALNIAGSLVSKSDTSTDSPDNSIVMGLRSLFAIIIWGLYFHRSRRVRDTFGANL